MYRLRIFAQNLAIFLSVVIDIGAILAFYLHRSPVLREYFPSYSFMPHYILGFALGLLGLLVSLNLYRRVRISLDYYDCCSICYFTVELYFYSEIF
jgi:hypothetical protein